jgi:predicted HicB family RNase H-like nuclease
VKPSDRYLKIVEWSEEDQCYVGTCPGLMYGGVQGDDELKVYKELCQVVDEWVRTYEEDGDPLPEATAGKDYSGKFVVRVGRELHKKLAIEALRAGESLNSYCIHALEQSARRHRRGSNGRHTPSVSRRRRTAKKSNERFSRE